MSTVSFSNENDLSKSAKSKSTLSTSKEGDLLSKSARVWDIDGDGELDDAELALKNMDKDRAGTLSREQMYDLMRDNLKTHTELFKLKKVVIG